MPLYSKDGSYPKPQTDGTNGWIQVLDPPTGIPEGKELRWLNWEWVVREKKPEDRTGYQWNWKHDTKEWVECEHAGAAEPQVPTAQAAALPHPETALSVTASYSAAVPSITFVASSVEGI